MAEYSGFFDANIVDGEYDRVYLAEDFAKYFASFIGNGVYAGKSNELMVSQNTVADMSIKVLTGQGFINGHFYENTEELPLTIDVADGVLNRIDIIVLRYNKTQRVIRLAIKKGESASSAVAPTIERSADVYELELAQVYIKAGATNITQANITDMRLDSSVCGFVTGLIHQLDTSEYGQQLTSFINQYMTDCNEWFEEFSLKSVEEINELKIQLEGIIAESDLVTLTNEIAMVANEAAMTSQTLGFTKKNLIPYPYVNTTKEVNGVTFTVNSDGTVVANGTPTADVIFVLNNIKLETAKKYIVSDGLSDSSQNTYYMQLYSTSAKTLPASYGNGLNGVEFTAEDVVYTVRLVIKTTVSNLVFKPMIRRAEILNGTYEPYKLSVIEMMREDEDIKGCFYRVNSTGVKEWINPPLIPGIEYCTTERWDNKHVYQKTFYISALAGKGTIILETGAQLNNVISVSGYAVDSIDLKYYPFPVILPGQIVPVSAVSEVKNNGTLSITTTTDVSYLKAYITVKYTK